MIRWYLILVSVLLAGATLYAEVPEPPQFHPDTCSEPTQAYLQPFDVAAGLSVACAEPPQFHPDRGRNRILAPIIRRPVTKTVSVRATTMAGNHWHQCPNGHYYQHSGGNHTCPECGRSTSRTVVSAPRVTKEVIVGYKDVLGPPVAVGSGGEPGYPGPPPQATLSAPVAPTQVASAGWVNPTSVTYSNEAYACPNCPGGVAYGTVGGTSVRGLFSSGGGCASGGCPSSSASGGGSYGRGPLLSLFRGRR